MKQIRFKWKNVLASVALANLIACSGNDIPQVDMRQEQVNGSRTTELVTRTIELQAVGTLQAKVEEAMGDSAVTTLQKLILSGPFSSTDMTYLHDSLTGLTVLDMKNVQIKASDIAYRDYHYFLDNQICHSMFYQMDSLREVVLPSTIIEIGNEAFYDCDSLRSVVIPDQVKAIRSYAFFSCDSLYAMTLPSKLEVLEHNAYNQCGALTSVVIPEAVKEIGSSVFYNCASLSSIILPLGLEKIGNKAFWWCPFATIDLPKGLKEIGSYAFYCCSNLKKMIVPETVTKVGDGFVSGSGIRSLIWNPAIDVPYCHSVSNCFLFVNTDQIGVENVNNWKSIVIDGYAETTINVDDGYSSGEFANLTEFTAKKLTYTKNFSSWPQTTFGGSSGWQTIVLPFAPDSIYHETKGQIAPFNSGIEGAKPFWLRELTDEGFVDVTKIEANKPYIIAMPNHDSYLDEYRLYGNVTFVARNQVLTVTPTNLEPSVGPEFELHPTFKYVDRSDEVYALSYQHGYYEEENMWYYKSFFFKNRADVRKFNAYATPLDGGRSSRSSFGLDTRSKETRASYLPNKTGVPQIGDM